MEQYSKAKIFRYEMQLANNESTISVTQGHLGGFTPQDCGSPGMPYNDQDIYARSTTLNEPGINFDRKSNLKTMVSLRNIETKTGSSQQRKERLHT